MIWRCVATLMVLVGLAAPIAAQDIPVANPPLATVAITLTALGRPHHYLVEIARTTEEQRRGLMVRTVMPSSHGMIFPMAPPRTAAFWMEGTVLPLDLVFVTPDHRVGRIAADAVPFDRTPIPSAGVVGAVLELNAGEAKRIGLAPGDAVRYDLDAGRKRR